MAPASSLLSPASLAACCISSAPTQRCTEKPELSWHTSNIISRQTFRAGSGELIQCGSQITLYWSSFDTKHPHCSESSSPVSRSWVTAAVRPTPDEPRPVVLTANGATFMIALSIWDFATPGSPTSRQLMSPRRWVPFSRLRSLPEHVLAYHHRLEPCPIGASVYFACMQGCLIELY